MKNQCIPQQFRGMTYIETENDILKQQTLRVNKPQPHLVSRHKFELSFAFGSAAYPRRNGMTLSHFHGFDTDTLRDPQTNLHHHGCSTYWNKRNGICPLISSIGILYSFVISFEKKVLTWKAFNHRHWTGFLLLMVEKSGLKTSWGWVGYPII